MSIRVHNITKNFGDFRALDQVDLYVHSGELVALLGPSGSGKTTLLRIMAGLEQAEKGGRVEYHGKDVTAIPVGRRKVGFVFQHYAMFNRMTVFENVAFGLRVKPWRSRPSRSVIRERVLDLLHRVRLDGLENRYPNQLSGGQRQRVALARALAVEPQVLLLDEPFGALDAKVRKELRQWLREFHDQIRLTSVFVTHDQDEAFEIADRIVIMNQGRIEQVGYPEEVFRFPANDFVINFLGETNVFPGYIRNGRAIFDNLSFEVTGKGSVDQLKMIVRPHEFKLSRIAGREPGIFATVNRIYYSGATVRLLLSSDTGRTLRIDVSVEEAQRLRLQMDDLVYAGISQFRVFSSQGPVILDPVQNLNENPELVITG